MRHATASAGLRRESVRIDLVDVAEGRLVLDASWPLERGDSAADVRSRLIEALIERAPGLDVRLVTVGSQPTCVS